MKAGVLLGLTLVLGLTVAYFIHRQHQFGEHPASGDAIETGGEELSPPVLARHESTNHRMRPTLTAPPSPPEPSHDDGRSPRRPVPRDIVTEIESAFQLDAAPGKEAMARTAAITTSFADVRASGSHLNSVACRATRCKLEIDFSDQAASNRVLQDMFDMFSSAGLSQVGDLGFYVTRRVALPDGPIRTDVHLFPVERTAARPE